MSRIEQLIAQLRPEGVDYKAIGDFCELVRGNGMPKSDFAESGVGCIHYGQIYTHYGAWTTETKSFVSAEKAEKLAKVDPGDLVITNTSENIEDVCKAVAWIGEAQIVTGGHATVMKHDQDPKYLSYYLQTPHFFAEKKRHAIGTKVIDVSAKSLARIRIPVPPLEVQREIVKILDNFTQLEARSRQYKYYRDTLLSFADRTDVPWAALGDIGEFIRGRRFTKADYVEEGIACIHYGDIYTQYGTTASSVKTQVRSEMSRSLRYAKPGDVVITDVGETVEDVGKPVAWLGTDDVAIHDHCYAFRHPMNPAFVSYCMQTTSFIAEKAKYVARTKVNTLLMKGFAKIRIPVPPLKEQARIVAILDNFDTLVNDLSSGLPAEITARRQQYAHYRDRLLTFKEAP